MTRPARRPPVYRAGAWMALTIVSFMGVAMSARSLAPAMSAQEMLFWRSVVGALVLAPLAAPRGFAAVRTRRPWVHLGRNVVHFGGQYGWTVGVTLLPLAEVFALEFTVPVWLAIIATVLLGERISAHRAIAVAGGFAGVLMVVRPGAGLVDPATLLVLGAAMCFAGSLAMVKSLMRTDTALSVVFWMCLMQMPMALLPAIPVWVWPGVEEIPALLTLGVAALGAHYGLARALRIADAVVVAPLDFVRLPAAALVGFALYAEPIDLWTIAGASLIFASNYQSLRREVGARGG